MAILTSLWGAGGGLRGGGGLSFDRRAKSDVVGEVSRGNYDGGYECCDDAPPAYGLVCDDAPPPYDPKIDWEDVRVRERKGKGGGKAKRGGQNQGNGGGGNKKKNDDRGDDGEGEKGTGGGDAAGGAGDPPGGGGNDPSPPPNAGGAKKKKKSKKAQWDPDDDEKKDEEFDPLANWDENETAEAENDVSTTEPTNQPEDDAFLGLGATGKKKKRKNKNDPAPTSHPVDHLDSKPNDKAPPGGTGTNAGETLDSFNFDHDNLGSGWGSGENNETQASNNFNFGSTAGDGFGFNIGGADPIGEDFAKTLGKDKTGKDAKGILPGLGGMGGEFGAGSFSWGDANPLDNTAAGTSADDNNWPNETWGKKANGKGKKGKSRDEPALLPSKSEEKLAINPASMDDGSAWETGTRPKDNKKSRGIIEVLGGDAEASVQPALVQDQDNNTTWNKFGTVGKKERIIGKKAIGEEEEWTVESLIDDPTSAEPVKEEPTSSGIMSSMWSSLGVGKSADKTKSRAAEKKEKEAAKKAAKDAADKEAAEKAEKEAAEKVEKEAAEKAEKEKAEKEAAEKAAKEAADKQKADEDAFGAALDESHTDFLGVGTSAAKKKTTIKKAGTKETKTKSVTEPAKKTESAGWGFLGRGSKTATPKEEVVPDILAGVQAEEDMLDFSAPANIEAINVKPKEEEKKAKSKEDDKKAKSKEDDKKVKMKEEEKKEDKKVKINEGEKKVKIKEEDKKTKSKEEEKKAKKAAEAASAPSTPMEPVVEKKSKSKKVVEAAEPPPPPAPPRSPLPGEFPLEEAAPPPTPGVAAVVDEASKPSKRSEKHKSSSKRASKVAEVEAPPKEKKRERSKPVEAAPLPKEKKKERPKVVREPGSSSWAFWGATSPPPKTGGGSSSSRRESRVKEAPPVTSPAREARPSLTRSKSSRRANDVSSGSERYGRAGSTTRGMGFSFFGIGGGTPSRSKSTRERERPSRRHSTVVPPTGDIPEKAAKLAGIPTKSRREKAPPPETEDDDLVFVDHPRRNKRPSAKMHGALKSPPQEPPNLEFDLRPALQRRSTTSSAKRGGGLMSTIFGFGRPAPSRHESENRVRRDDEGKRLRREERKLTSPLAETVETPEAREARRAERRARKAAELAAAEERERQERRARRAERAERAEKEARRSAKEEEERRAERRRLRREEREFNEKGKGGATKERAGRRTSYV